MSACCGPGRGQADCAAVYEQDWVRALADHHFHPGGPDLTRRTADSLRLEAGAPVLDLGCGAGTTAALLTREYGFAVTGVDLGENNVVLARQRCPDAPVEFVRADACRLPFADSVFDGVIAECSYSLFADQPAALAEVRRVLRPNAPLAITDMAIDGELPPDLLERAGDWACLVGARSPAAYEAGFEEAGFEVLRSIDESASLSTLLRQLKRRFLSLAAGAVFARSLPQDLDIATFNHWVARFEAVIDGGSLRYVRFLLR